MKRILRALPIVAALVVVLAALYLVSDVEHEETRLGLLVLWVFLITGIALLILIGAIAGRLLGLIRDLRAKRPGARLARRLVIIFFGLTLPPVLILYFFAVEFLSETIDRWFDVQSEQALADAVTLGQLFIELRTREARDQLADLPAALDGRDEDEQFRTLVRRVSRAGPIELTILDAGGRTRAFAHIDPVAAVPDLPLDFALSQALRTDEYAAAEPGRDGRLQVRVLRRLADEPARVLQAIYPLPDDFSDLTEGIAQAYHRYQNAAYLRDQLRRSLIQILTLVLALTGLLAMLLALNAARRLVAPVRDLADATAQMAAGHRPQALPIGSRDELGFLVHSFNTMAREVDTSRRRLEESRRYLEVVLGRLSSGVLAIAADGRLGAYNEAAGHILDLDLSGFVHAPLTVLARAHPHLAPLTIAIAERAGGREWRQEIKLEASDKPLVLMCRGSALPEDGGHVVVFDDVTVLDQAQREAAWSEVARRLAHEVKNPLTPIRLAAERLDMKLAGSVPDSERALLAKTTGTIIAQVDALKRLVDRFGDYARRPARPLQAVKIADVIDEVVDLYTSAGTRLTFQFDLNREAAIQVDPDALRQVLHNLIRNAFDAAVGQPLTLTITTRRVAESAHQALELILTDNGPGFPDAVLANPFEPYVSTKPGGTGLGLAIVRRIVEELGGTIALANPPGGGASVSIRLPL